MWLDILTKNMATAAPMIDRWVKEELRDQGHYASGSAEDSIEWDVKQDDGILYLTFYGEDYLLDLDEHIPPSEIDYQPEELIDWVLIVMPDLSLEQADTVAYRIYMAHLIEGMPTSGAYAYTENGRRTGWIQASVIDRENEVEAAFNLAMVMELISSEIVKRVSFTA